VVFDSDPESEYLETLDKGKALFKALSELNDEPYQVKLGT
jgi:anthranilate/para-aminobenzoate synthase component I